MTASTTAEPQAPAPRQRRLRTEIPGPASRELQERRANAVAAGVSSVLPVYVTSASGGLLTDADGNVLIDFGSGIAVTNVGHSAPAVVDRVRKQACWFTHTCFMVTPYEGYVEVCEALAELTPGDHAKKSVLFNSGAEAVENAVKIARAATGRQAVVVFDHAYHGRTNLTMGMTAKSVPYKHGFGPFAPEVYRVPGSYPYRDGLAGPEARGAGHRPDREADRRRPGGRGRLGADPGRGRLHRARARLPARDFGLVHAKTASCSSPTRSRRASAAPAPGSRPPTRTSSRT